MQAGFAGSGRRGAETETGKNAEAGKSKGQHHALLYQIGPDLGEILETRPLPFALRAVRLDAFTLPL